MSRDVSRLLCYNTIGLQLALLGVPRAVFNLLHLSSITSLSYYRACNSTNSKVIFLKAL